MEQLLNVNHITVCYNRAEAVKDISFELDEGEILAIVGESGSGKSTIIKSIMNLLGKSGIVRKGDIYYKNKNIIDMPENEKRKLFGPEIAMVFQDSKSSLCPVRKIGAQVYEAISEHMAVSKKEAFNMAGEIMDKIKLDSDILNKYPFELSGGMNQRVGICMAMVMKPKLLIADEPTSALDVTVQKRVMEEMLLLRETYNTSIIIVTHNIALAEKMSDKILVLKDGCIVEYGNTKNVLNNPKSDYTKLLISSVLCLNKTGSCEVN